MTKVQPQPSREIETPQLHLTRTEPSHIHIPRPSRLRQAARERLEAGKPLPLEEAA